MTAPSLYSFAIFVTDIDRARTFYDEVLRLPVGKAGAFGFQLFEGPPFVSVHPAQHPDSRAMVGRQTGITIEVPKLLDYCSELGHFGVKFLAEPTQQAFGMMAMIADPDGNVLALWEDNVTPPEPAE
ncbi:MAG TPA: VOC family protein [Gemmatimonadales bacterium]|jgi:predicted enzyme related to lactoylglutathione lyase|nr:VOC family protein [Gemmatimonadales bacterium]